MNDNRHKVVILGSTGSIGRQTVEICTRYSDRVEVVGLATFSNEQLLAEQAAELGVSRTVLAKTDGPEALVELAASTEANLVLNALVGAAGVEASYATLKAGKTLALANKESLVVAGEVLMPLAKPNQLLPVDSEHSALFQCLLGEEPDELANLWITGSGGPFRGRKRSSLASVTKEEALAHPNWVMGAKISIDSSTLMNKGLEVIEAHHIFAIPYSKIKTVQHPGSCVHSLVEFVDGSFKAHLGVTDMRIPIQYALSYPKRWPAVFEPASLDLCELGSLHFSALDAETFGCLRLAREAGEAGGTLPCVLNAANEVAVEAFLNDHIGFLDIERIVETCLDTHERQDAESIEQLLAVDQETRIKAKELF
ncbi:MAG: 1-deoxy-D-xylulose-5-phosphate reductoisomerase [Coriobacteriia bacterium]|nr:1-deoxy-D-xylulose-5-phosphate reductoisomerase [Coriobacteriia bacterium]MCL2749564.1 1-deoxy-D-xylulose-5-phosphate reductoisomerase [Coriobacteriia bacterium]